MNFEFPLYIERERESVYIYVVYNILLCDVFEPLRPVDFFQLQRRGAP